MTAHDVSRHLLALRDRIFSGGAPTHAEGVALLGLAGHHVLELFATATALRDHYKAHRVHLCAIVNARSGNCPEDCAFCAQSVHNRAEVAEFPMISVDAIVEAARSAERAGARCFGIVTSGRSVGTRDLDTICDAVRRIRAELAILPDASLGLLGEDLARRLKDAGLNGYHHNVETAPSYYPRVCTTHSFEENVATLRLAKRFGFTVCSGGILGLGETLDQRVELAEVLGAEDVDRVCLNFFIPVKGTRLEGATPMKPLEILKTIAVYRLFFPSKDINVCAGRELHLRDMQGMIFLAGASATMIGNYLTQEGRAPEDDLQLLRDLEMEW
ncbi:MAG TPA: biotin synthase BioB [Planctomycetota bacterium]|nr:biotin synthase BioB [Planctomycetota bacterium]HUV38208.1 biotin synthase BioB [Planctomycetota bacterium]